MDNSMLDPALVMSGIKYLGASDSGGACIVRFWLGKEEKGWEYKIEWGWLDEVKKLARRGDGVAFNWCKNKAIATYGPYDKSWKLISNG